MAAGFGYRVPQYGSSWEQLDRPAHLAEELGFDGVWLNDHWVPDQRSGRHDQEDALRRFARLVMPGFEVI